MLFERIWYAMESMGILAGDESLWGTRFSIPCASVLRPEQRAALPGEAGRVAWVNGDATPGIASSLDFTDRIFIRERLNEGLYAALRARLPDIPEDVVIGCGELMQYIAHAATRGMYWRGRSIWLGTDNMNTKGWVKFRYSQVPEIQFLLRILNVMEGVWGFSTTAF